MRKSKFGHIYSQYHIQKLKKKRKNEKKNLSFGGVLVLQSKIMKHNKMKIIRNKVPLLGPTDWSIIGDYSTRKRNEQGRQKLGF